MKASCKCSNICAGVIFLIFGVLFLLGTTGVWPEFTFSKYWPVVLIVIGIHNLLCPCASGDCGCDEKGSPKKETRPEPKPTEKLAVKSEPKVTKQVHKSKPSQAPKKRSAKKKKK